MAIFCAVTFHRKEEKKKLEMDFVVFSLAIFAEIPSEVQVNRPFPSYSELHYESEAKCIVYVMKISFHLYANKTNFYMKRFFLKKLVFGLKQ